MFIAGVGIARTSRCSPPFIPRIPRSADAAPQTAYQPAIAACEVDVGAALAENPPKGKVQRKLDGQDCEGQDERDKAPCSNVKEVKDGRGEEEDRELPKGG